MPRGLRDGCLAGVPRLSCGVLVVALGLSRGLGRESTGSQTLWPRKGGSADLAFLPLRCFRVFGKCETPLPVELFFGDAPASQLGKVPQVGKNEFLQKD